MARADDRRREAAEQRPFGLSGLGAIVVVIALYAVGTWLAFLADVGLFLIPATSSW